MKKIFLLLMLTMGLHAEPYFGIGGTFTDKQEDCRAYAFGLVGYNINDKFAIEGRYSHIMRGDTQDIGIYGKMKVGDNFYGLLGIEKSLDAVKEYNGFVFGAGFTVNKTSFELGYKHSTEAPFLNVVFRF